MSQALGETGKMAQAHRAGRTLGMSEGDGKKDIFERETLLC